jgi:hypothetical protein
MKKTVILFCIVSMLYSCKKEQPSMAVLNEGCDCATEVSANFLMEEMATPINWSHTKQHTDTDTMYANGNVRFYALEPDAEYTWIIGSEIIHEREFYRYFNASHVGQTFSMTLIVNKTPNSICLPNDDGIDTLVRQLTIVEEMNHSDFFNTPNPRLEGTFRVKDQNMADSIDIVVELVGSVDLSQDFILITNFDGNGTTKNFLDDGLNYHQIWFHGYSFNSNSYILHKMNGEIELYFSAINISGSPSYLYRGRKL